jgi:hypothetical protein
MPLLPDVDRLDWRRTDSVLQTGRCGTAAMAPG